MTLDTKNTMTYSFTEEERKILKKAYEILEAWEDNIESTYRRGHKYLEGSWPCSSAMIDEILSNEYEEIDMGEYV
jgi:hypothetical protein